MLAIKRPWALPKSTDSLLMKEIRDPRFASIFIEMTLSFSTALRLLKVKKSFLIQSLGKMKIDSFKFNPLVPLGLLCLPIPSFEYFLNEETARKIQKYKTNLYLY
ncbi:hypothetical protein [Priestia endophytica]|uniref:hypothetical protein n=1 Tax=Priestia endophytica TaxID=135735 RepID=UPI001A8C4E94|nr:hypothetical protein [Priestia endophytica]